MFFDGWESIARVAVLAAATYFILVAALRIIGEQALAKMSAYDVVVTVALGSLLVSIPLSTGVTLADGIAAIATVLLLQEATRLLVKRTPKAKKIVKERPHLVLWEGQLLPERMSEVNVTEEEVWAAVRSGGLGSISKAQAVVLESDGEWSVIPREKAGDLSAFTDLEDMVATAQLAT
jgi:uncharacterized membrane protein YcaP (DUF421 family)